MPIIEVAGQHVERTHAAPLEQCCDALSPAPDCGLGHRSQCRTTASHVQNHFGNRHHLVEIPLVCLHLMRVRDAQPVEGFLLIRKEQPRRGLVVEHVQVAGIALEVGQPVT